MGHSDQAGRTKPQGIGARVPRSEDFRHLHGKGHFVADYVMPELCEVAFSRSPVAHALIESVRIPEGLRSVVFTREMLVGAQDIVADSSLPTYQSSAQPPLASGKVRFVGEPVVMAFAPTRAQAEDILEQVDVQYQELPVFLMWNRRSQQPNT